MPFLRATEARLGATLTVTTHGTTGHLFALSVSLPVVPMNVAPFGELWLDSRFKIDALLGTYRTAREQLNIRVPLSPALRGLPIAWQALSGAWPSVVYTNVVVMMIY